MSSDPRDAKLIRKLTSGLLWLAAFCFSLALYLTVSKSVRDLPSTDPVAVGRITVDGFSKLGDYVGAAVFYLLVPLATVGFRMLLERVLRSLNARLEDGSGRTRIAASLALALPLCLSPFLFIATRSEGRALFFPIILSALASWSVRAWTRHEWLRSLFRRDLQPFHAIVVSAAFSWLLFHYTTSGARLASDRTLFLEIPFIILLFSGFTAATIGLAWLIARVRGEIVEDVFPRVAWAASPMLLLAPLGLSRIESSRSLWAVGALCALALLAATFLRRTISPKRTRWIAGWLVFPMLLFCLNYASTASSTHWTDLFHRGEALGPASDYLAGKIPYRDVFVLHGMFENGFLDAGLMSIFGRDVAVSAMRVIVFDCLGLAAIGILAMAVFNSIPLAIVTVAVALVTSVGNQRAVFEILSVAFLVLAIRRGVKWPLFAGGAFAALALFYSFETGLYSTGGAILTFIAIALLARFRAADAPFRIVPAVLAWAAGFGAASIPVLLYLVVNDALDDFFVTSFVTLPSVIDAVWALPYPRIETMFATDRSLRAFGDFVLGERIRFAFNPALLIIALVYLAARTFRRSTSRSDLILLALTFASVLTQRSALGRADFPHQYFAAFLAGPIVVLLIIAFLSNLAESTHGHAAAGRAYAGVVLLTMAASAFVALWVPDLMNARIDGSTAFRSRMEGGGNPDAPRITRRVEAVGEEVRKRLDPGDPMFDFSNQPALYFFADRPNPTRFYQIPILSMPMLQQEAIQRLEETKPKIVLRGSPSGFDSFDGITNDLRAPALAAYIGDRYRYSATVEGVELWERIDSSAPFTLANYMAEHRLPSPQEVNDARTSDLVFPSVGSGPGAGNSVWRTDLYLYNPTDRALRIHLRYPPAEKAETVITLGPGEVRFDQDVVAGLFSAPGTFGNLLIRIPESAPVIARVISFDAARAGSGAPIAPMTAGQAATADGPHRRLLVPGSPAAAARRFNIDIVNIGDGPAEVEVKVIGSGGQMLGQPLTGGLVEKGAWKISDAESQMGTAIHQNAVLQITPRSGSVVAYASVIDASTGHSLVVPATPVP